MGGDLLTILVGPGCRFSQPAPYEGVPSASGEGSAPSWGGAFFFSSLRCRFSSAFFFLAKSF